MAIGSRNPFGRSQGSHPTLSAKVESAHPVPKAKGVQVNWRDGHASIYNTTWLRVNCPANVHASGQRLASPGDVLDVTPVTVAPAEGKEGMRVTWSDGHESVYPSQWLRLHDSSVSSIIDRQVRQWRAGGARVSENQGSWPVALRSWEAIPKVAFADFTAGEEGVYQLLRSVNNTGLCTLEGVGTEPDTVESIAQRISPLSHSMLYGRTFDVISQDNARNIAFTSEHLRPHQDLVYYESPPGLQLLHCLHYDASVEGGASLFLDAFEAARLFRKAHAEAFSVLTTTPATFQKIRKLVVQEEGEGGEGDKGEVEKGGYSTANAAALSASYMTYQRPHIEVDTDGEITGVFWAPMFEGTLHVPSKDIQPYYEAYALFQAFLEVGDFAEEHTVRARMQPGQCMVFNNRRMLHGREGFSGSGKRHMQGCYTNVDESLSRYIVLHNDHIKATSGGTIADKDAASHGAVRRWGNGTIPQVMQGL
ncbi:hypothetical protein JKP88DRAFT_265882 [Tribonema minus]|uniref:Gamma-butyrobetaine dioxygenase n=1 Tax=Tribonema minus TaxID=303371 RepID=A0A836C7R7_9STRA|nr:hypothetical protein JKP88DRAFT_265882 [Tribonema minus]